MFAPLPQSIKKHNKKMSVSTFSKKIKFYTKLNHIIPILWGTTFWSQSDTLFAFYKSATLLYRHRISINIFCSNFTKSNHIIPILWGTTFCTISDTLCVAKQHNVALYFDPSKVPHFSIASETWKENM